MSRAVGFTRDGSQFGYCARSGGIDPQVLSCERIPVDDEMTEAAERIGHSQWTPADAVDDRRRTEILERRATLALPRGA
jgi:hypothetical protein